MSNVNLAVASFQISYTGIPAFVPINLTVTCLFVLGPSNSQNIIACHCPRRALPSLKVRVSDGPMMLDLMCACALPSTLSCL